MPSVPYKLPRPTPIKLLRNGAGVVTVSGWESSFALGIAPGLDSTYSSVLLMSGMILEDGFTSLELAHQFNLAVLRSKLFVGTPSIGDMMQRTGGPADTSALVAQIKRKVLQEKST